MDYGLESIRKLPSHRIRAALAAPDPVAALRALAGEWRVKSAAKSALGLARAIARAMPGRGRWWGPCDPWEYDRDAAACRADWVARVAARRLRAGMFRCSAAGLLPLDEDLYAMLRYCGRAAGYAWSDELTAATERLWGAGLETLAAYRARQRAAIWERIKPLAEKLYRTSGTRWAGGRHSVDVTVDAASVADIRASGDSQKVWSSNKKWSGNNSHHSFRVCPDWKAQVDKQGLAVLDGALCLHATPLPLPPGVDGAWKVVLARQGRGFELNTQDAYAVRFGGGLGVGGSLRIAMANAIKPVKERLLGVSV